MGCSFERQLADLVEEHGAAAGELEAAHLRGVRAGKGAALAPEQLALDERRRHRGAIHDHERPAAPRAAVVDRPRHQFLAGAGLAAQQDRCIGRRHLLDPRHHVAQGVALADDRVIEPDGVCHGREVERPCRKTNRQIVGH